MSSLCLNLQTPPPSLLRCFLQSSILSLSSLSPSYLPLSPAPNFLPSISLPLLPYFVVPAVLPCILAISHFSLANFSLPSGPEIAPANFVATRHRIRSGSIVLQWTAIPPEHRNGLLTGYVVTTVPSNGQSQPREENVEPNLVSFEVAGLTPNTQYNVSISAFTNAGRGPAARAQVTLFPRGNHYVQLIFHHML